MPLNSAAYAFQPLAVFPVLQPTVKEPTVEYNGLTAAKLNTAGFTSKSITATATLVEGATNRTKGIYLANPSDNTVQVTFANQSTVQAVVPAPPGGTGLPTVTTSTAVVPLGFALPPGITIFVGPCNDPIYAITPTGQTATVYFLDM